MVDVFIQDKIKKLIPDDFDKATIIKIDGKYFVFDDESFEKYKLFSEADHLFRIIEIDGYLVRERKCDGKLTSFHRWLMDDEIEKISQVVDQFSAVMKRRFIEKVDSGYIGWDDPEMITNSYLVTEMRNDINSQKPEQKMMDIAIRSLILWLRT